MEYTDGAQLTAPVVVGAVSAAALGGVPFISINGAVAHYSGSKLANMVMQAVGELGATISIED